MSIKYNYISAEEALSVVKSGNRVFLHGSAATPHHLIKTMVAQAGRLRDVELVSISLQGQVDFVKPEYADNFFINSLFVSASVREAVNSSRGAYVPVFLSEIPELFYRNILPLDVALLHVSPPDKHGFCSLGVSVDIARSAMQTAKVVIAQVNPQMPRTHGDGQVHVSRFDALVWADEPLPELKADAVPQEIPLQIGKHCAALIEDGATLQMGIGAIPDAVLASLHSHKELGVHTEMFSDGIMPLLEKGVITNQHKRRHPGKLVSGFVMGTRKLYDFIDDNPQVALLDINYVNDPHIIRANPKVTAINSALEIDITGQVVADSLGTYQFSGVGGQMDFIRGAARSEGGKPIIALPSVTSKGASRIVPALKDGAGVVTTRAHAHYIVTEYGAVNLFGKNLEQRAKALISIAHPNHREQLERDAYKRFG